MTPKPEAETPHHVGTGKLARKVAIITGGDSGIGKAVAIAFAKEGAKVVISYLNEDDDALDTKAQIENKYHGQCLLIKGDLSINKMSSCLINQTIEEYGQLDILVNHAGEQYQTN